MAQEAVYMPKFGMTMTEAEIIEWLVETGDRVEEGTALLTIETEKTTTEIESPKSGFIGEILYSEGETVEVGTILAYVVDEESEIGTIEKENLGTLPSSNSVSENPHEVSVEEEAGNSHQDGSDRTIPLQGLRKKIADKMQVSLSTTAQLTLIRDVVVDNLKKVKEKGNNFSHNDLIIKIFAEALKKNESARTQLLHEQLVLRNEVNIGFAVALEKSLIVPVIKNADTLSLEQLKSERKRLIEKAKSNTLSPEETSGHTASVTNLGTYNIDAFTPILNPPETVILGVGRILDRPWVVDGELQVCSVVTLSLTFDHQVLDGADAAEFFNSVCELIDNPQAIMD